MHPDHSIIRSSLRDLRIMIQRKKWGRFSNGCTKDLGSSLGGVKEESRGGGGDMNTKSTHVQRQRVQPSIKIITVMAKDTRNKIHFS